MLHRLMRLVLLGVLSMPIASVAGPQQVEMPDFASEHFKKLMRGHLDTLQEVILLLSQREYAKAADTAEQGLGMSSVEMHFERHVGKYMPKGMRAQGERMHEAATRFATDARNAAQEDELDKALSSLSVMIEGCVSCHSVYRLGESGK